MLNRGKQFTCTVGGKEMTATFNDAAPQPNSSVLVRWGDTVVLATVVMSRTQKSGATYFPLTVDFEEKFYAAGKMPGMRFVRREGRPSDHAILTGRFIDRTIRPLFDQRMRYDIQVSILVLSYDKVHHPDVAALLAASLVLHTSDVPWNGPVGSVRVAKINGNLVINATEEERATAEFEMLVSGKDGKVNMLEGKSAGASEEELADAIERGLKEISVITKFQEEVRAAVGKEKRVPTIYTEIPELVAIFNKQFLPELKTIVAAGHGKADLYNAYDALVERWNAAAREAHPDAASDLIGDILEHALDAEVHRLALEDGKRVDGRAFDEIRPLSAEVGVLPRTHGSGLFYRGDTHILSSVTLGPPSEDLLVYTMTEDKKKRFIHQYNFPPFSVGETGRMGSPGRREIGHGALAEKALEPVIPDAETFPYIIRIVSETLSSNGSSSMGSVSASTIALMDAGVPIKEPVAGIAMGLFTGPNDTYKVLTDLQGFEDHYGDMDFKVAGTRTAVTAVQLDIKVDGISMPMIRDTFNDARVARLKVLDVIQSAIAAPRTELSPYAPRIVTLTINPEKIRDLIGPGGKVINAIIDATGCQIDIEQDGTVLISSPTPESLDAAVQQVKAITKEPEIGETFTGKVTRIFQFGAMVEIGPNQEGLVHISELAPYRVGEVTDIVHVGDSVPVKVIGIDDLGRVNLSIKAVATLEQKPRPSGEETKSHAPQRPHQNNSHGRQGRR